MNKTKVIQNFCDDILQYPSILNEDIMTHLCISAGLIEDHITGQGCDVLNKNSLELASYILKHISSCSRKIQDDAYFLLVELSCNTVH